MATAKQIAARKLFAARVKAGEFKRKKNPIAKEKLTSRAYVLRPSQATKNPPSKRLITRRTKALKAPKGYFPNPVKIEFTFPYAVQLWNPSKNKWVAIAGFIAFEYAEEYARLKAREFHTEKFRVMDDK